MNFRLPDASWGTALVSGLLVALVERLFAGIWPLGAAVAFVIVLFGVIGTDVAGALMAQQDLNRFGWPQTDAGRALYGRASLRLLALAAGWLGGSLALA